MTAPPTEVWDCDKLLLWINRDLSVSKQVFKETHSLVFLQTLFLLASKPFIVVTAEAELKKATLSKAADSVNFLKES